MVKTLVLLHIFVETVIHLFFQDFFINRELKRTAFTVFEKDLFCNIVSLLSLLTNLNAELIYFNCIIYIWFYFLLLYNYNIIEFFYIKNMSDPKLLNSSVFSHKTTASCHCSLRFGCVCRFIIWWRRGLWSSTWTTVAWGRWIEPSAAETAQWCWPYSRKEPNLVRPGSCGGKWCLLAILSIFVYLLWNEKYDGFFQSEKMWTE